MSNPMENIYGQVLEQARREIDDASSKIEELRRTLSLLEARVEASKSVYEAVAARLNLEDDHEEEAVPQAPPPESPPPEQAPEPPEEVEASSVDVAGNGSPAGGGFSMDLIRRHLEGKTSVEEDSASPEPTAASPAFPELSEAERKLIEEHMRSRQESK